MYLTSFPADRSNTLKLTLKLHKNSQQGLDPTCTANYLTAAHNGLGGVVIDTRGDMATVRLHECNSTAKLCSVPSVGLTNLITCGGGIDKG